MDILTVIFLGFPAFIILWSFIEYKIDRKRVKILCNEIKVGDTYRTSVYSDNPFEGTQHWDVEIIEIKSDWVKYKWSDGGISTKTKEDFIDYPFVKVK